ncbi:MAG TPA: DUF6232 family protein [Cyclobacteriaceae bacterium]|nr:DUF6232 family protein [Cyclobacteriaceae bacterium]
MNTEKTLYYTDGHEVSVTDAGFKVRKHLYNLTGITRHGLSVIYPARMPFAVLILVGAVVFVCGALNFIPAGWKTYVNLFGFSLLANSLFMIAGILVFLTGLLIMLKLREKYAVRIATAEGEKDVVVSASREYIKQIVDALNRAFLDLTTQRMKEKK